MIQEECRKGFGFRIIECPELKWTHKDHCVQLLCLHREGCWHEIQPQLKEKKANQQLNPVKAL